MILNKTRNCLFGLLLLVLATSHLNSQRTMTYCNVNPITFFFLCWMVVSEEKVLPTTRELGIGIVVYAPLGRGFLTGAFKTPEDVRDSRAHMPRFQGDNFYKNLELIEKVRALAAEKNCTLAQLAIAWVLAQGEDIITIPGAKNIPHLEENLASSSVRLTAEDLKDIEAIMPTGTASGTRYHEMAMGDLNG